MSIKKFFVAVVFSLLAFFALGQAHADAATTDNVYGRAWSDDIGWISFNNCDIPSNPATCSGTNYGVAMDPSTGNLTGEAWSDNIGWISFNQTSGCPIAGCVTQPKINTTTGNFSGFAWAMSAGGGWDGWIALDASEVGQSGWGLKANLLTGNITGAAWGDLVIGWMASVDLKIDNGGGGPKFNITSTAGAGGSISPTPNLQVTPGNNATFTMTANPGYKIDVLTVDGSPVPVASSYTFTNVQADHIINVTFKADSTTYTITACSPTNGTISPSTPQTVLIGGNRTYTINPDSGYMIANLVINGTPEAATGSYTFYNVQANQTICANFTPSNGTKFTIDVTAGAGGTISPGTKSFDPGDSQMYTIKANSGFTVESLTIDGQPSAVVGSYTFGNIQADHTISATFISSNPGGPYTITASSGPNGTVIPAASTSVAKGGSQTYTITPSPNYDIATLIIDGSPVTISGTYTFSNVQSNHTIHATFSLSGSGPGPGNGSPQCSNGIDDDLDGLSDYPNDPGCSSATDNTEKNTSVIYIER